ncbi:MAG: hypothetical protein ABJE47_11850 [bacterium]
MEALLDVSDSGAGWYKQTVRARVRIFATDGEHYFGRVLRKGSLVRIANTGARQTAPAGLNIRLLGPDCESLGPPTIQDIAFEGLAFKFGGIRCQGARSGLQNAEAVVAHFPDDPENAVAAQALDRERALFAILADKGMPSGGTLVGLGSTFVGFGATRQIATCVLYRAVPHLQMGDDDSTMWLRESDELTFAAIVGISRIFTTCWNGKWSVGSCTLPMFGFAPRWDPVSGLPLPSAKLLTAPFATPFGQPHIMPCSESEFSATNHARLGISALSARIKKGEESNIGTDMLGLASLCFELLANSRIDYGEGHRASWGGIIRVAGERVQFRQPGFVAIAAAAAKTAQGRALLIQMFQAVATGMLRNFTECQESLEREI